MTAAFAHGHARQCSTRDPWCRSLNPDFHHGLLEQAPPRTTDVPTFREDALTPGLDWWSKAGGVAEG